MTNNSKLKGSQALVSLYRLINSMSALHKKNLKKHARFSSSEKEQKYIILFDIIEQFISQNGEMMHLSEHLANNKIFTSSTTLYSAATYLFDRIMDQVRNSPNIIAQRHNKLLQSLQDIQYLFYQDMFTECYKVIREAKQIALEIDRPVYILELQIWEARIIARLSNIPWKLLEMQVELRDTLANIQLTYSTFLESQQLYFENKKPDHNILPQTQLLIEQLMSNENMPTEDLSPRLQYWKLVGLQYCSELQKSIRLKDEIEDDNKANTKDSTYYLKRNLEFLATEKGSIIAEEEPVNYFSVLENFLNQCLERKDEENFQSLMQSEFVKNYFKKEDVHRYRIICYYQMLYFLAFNQFEEACNYVEVENLYTNLKNRQHLISDQRMSIIRYSCIQALYLNSSFEKTIEWAKYLITNPRSQSNRLVFIVTELLYTICLFETKVFPNIDSQLDNLARKYKRREPKNKLLHEVIASMKYAARPQKGEYLKMTVKSKNKLDAHVAKFPPLGIYGPVLAWLGSRITGNPLAVEILKYNS